MTDEQLMHALIKDIGDAEVFMKSKSEFKKLKRWPGVVLDPDKRVTEINWERDYDDINLHGGSIGLRWLPMRLVSIRLRNQNLSGTVDMEVLPPCIEMLFLSYNELEGTVDLKVIPDTLQTIYLSYNKITGPLDLQFIPKNLQKLGLACNEIEQEKVVIGEFPPNFKWVSLSFNKIGSIVDPADEPLVDNQIEFDQ
eukprot:CAMPEP_0201515306 /NCGR_PEP_ID=MMETSP0161_2-20130828/6916_1 /ASSEMBLY_ACC=CAM_ASM_000251 /TAXON_ID=180227 /ORGANISM="Neoparamoeba aestuarina, Strain SoJaBio B1-5/56/2" /LENGTH=195 /DNA_ID=CAMNT_0047912103 /DNA_START=29 /DNA_END=616 /DNA_ORIENTATION=+